jgi:nucleotide-binding universal stress UspA family protein
MRNKHILLATDFSDAWADRLPEISTLFRTLGSTVSVVHVITSAFQLWLRSDALELQIKERLAHWLTLMQEQGITTQDHIVRTGNAAEEILAAAANIHCDIIMIAADPKRTFLGSTAEAVVRTAPQSVWVYHAEHFTKLQKIVCACDMSDESAKALQKAYSLAQEYSASLDVLYCLEVPNENTLGVSRSEAERRYEEYKVESRARFEAFVRTVFDSATLPAFVHLHLVWGKPSAMIVHHASDCQADLIVLGAKGKSNLQVLTLGSTAHNILRTARNSLFIVR